MDRRKHKRLLRRMEAIIARTPCGVCPRGAGGNCGNKRCNLGYAQEALELYNEIVLPLIIENTALKNILKEVKNSA